MAGVDEEVEEGGPAPPGPDSPYRDRRGYMESCDLDPQSLYGSYFHKLEGGVVVAAGAVVCEAQAGIYLFDFQWHDMPSYQLVVTLDELSNRDDNVEWRFYDTPEKLAAAYAENRLKQHQHEEA